MTEQCTDTPQYSLASKVQRKLDNLCKPPGSLGAIETIAARLCEIQRTLNPKTRPRHVTVFAADHGVTQEQVSAWPSKVTRAVVKIMQTHRTVSGVFAKSLDCEYEVVDVGLLNPVSDDNASFIDVARRRGTGNLRCEAAMGSLDFEHAWTVGKNRASLACDAGNVLLVGGEMGIGNTTAASCLIGALTESDPSKLVGHGAGIDESTYRRKRQVVVDATARVRALGRLSAEEVACEVGGLEIVALAGFFTEGAHRGATLLIDGLIATSAALLAASMQPTTRDHMIAGHLSPEPGHVTALETLQLAPILDLQMRLGEASGALTALPLLDLAATLINETAMLQDLDLG